MLTIRQPVGVAGANRPEDVVVIQLMLKLLHSGTRPGPYYDGSLDGRYSSKFTAAFQHFFRDHREELAHALKAGERHNQFKPGGSSFKLLQSYVKGQPLMREVAQLEGTTILYFRGQAATNYKTYKDYLIPADMRPPRLYRLARQDFKAAYSLVAISDLDTFVIEFHFPEIRGLLDPRTLQSVPLSSSKSIQEYLHKSIAGSAWHLGGRKGSFSVRLTPVSGQFSLESEERTGLKELAYSLYNDNALRRVIQVDPSQHGHTFLIPTEQQLHKLARDAYLVACGAEEGLGEKLLASDVANQIVQSVVKNAPTINPNSIKTHCRTCAGYKAAIDSAVHEIYELKSEYNATIQPRLPKFQNYLTVIQLTRFSNDSTFELLLKAAFEVAQVPLDTGALVEDGEFHGDVAGAFTVAGSVADEALKVYAEKGVKVDDLSRSLVDEIIALLKKRAPTNGRLFLAVRVASRLFPITAAAITLWELYDLAKKDIHALVNRFYYGSKVKEAEIYMETEGKQLRKDLRQYSLKLANAISILHGEVIAADMQKCGDDVWGDVPKSLQS